jgi:hypothetical protein
MKEEGISMNTEPKALKELDEEIRSLHRAVETLRSKADGFPAVERNAARILAAVDMLERNVCDILEFGEG